MFKKVNNNDGVGQREVEGGLVFGVLAQDIRVQDTSVQDTFVQDVLDNPSFLSADANQSKTDRSSAHEAGPHHHQSADVEQQQQQERYAGSDKEGCCGLSLDELSHEGLGQKQQLRSADDQNKFVAAMIRKGLYCNGWKLVITGVGSCADKATNMILEHGRWCRTDWHGCM